MTSTCGAQYRLVGTIAFVSIAVLASLAVELPKRMIWNASKSVPIGLYWTRPADVLAVGDLVVVRPPAAIVRFAMARGYLGAGVPMLKHVAALPNTIVCRSGMVVRAGGIRVVARRFDRRGRGLPVWSGCRRLATGEVFLLNPLEPDSLDGRYFGPLPRDSIVGRAMPLWTTGR